MNNLTVRELRSILFAVDDQDMTVRELRAALTALDGQEQEATKPLIDSITRR